MICRGLKVDAATPRANRPVNQKSWNMVTGFGAMSNQKNVDYSAPMEDSDRIANDRVSSR